MEGKNISKLSIVGSWGDTLEVKRGRDDGDEMIEDPQEGKQITLYQFSEKIGNLGVKVNKIKRLIKGQGTQGNAQKLKLERDEANKLRKSIRAILNNMAGKSSSAGQLHKERFERIKTVFEKVDEKLEQIDQEILEEEPTQRLLDVETEEAMDDDDSDKSYGQTQQKQDMIKKEEQTQKLTGWQDRYMKLEMDIAVETRGRVQALESDFEDLKTMFTDMETLVDRQGEGLTVIEKDVEESIENVEVAVEKLKVGISYQKSSRWKFLAFGGLTIAVLVFVVIAVWVGVKKF
jgi:hypothetical protein